MRVGIIGLGRITTLLEEDPLRYKPCTHSGAMRQFNHIYQRTVFQIEALCDLDPIRLRLARDKLPAALWDTDYRRLLRRQAARPLDLLVIGSWTESHSRIATAAIHCGIRSLVIEKPLALDYAEAAGLLKLARRFGCQIWLNFERRYHPGYIKIKHLVDQKEFGPLRAIRGRVLGVGGPAIGSREGPLLHDGIHWLDLLQWYAGPPVAVRGRMQTSIENPAVETTAWLDLQYPEVLASLECGGQRSYFEFQIELDFAAGRIESSNSGQRFFEARESRLYSGFRDLHEIEAPALPPLLQPTFSNPWLNLYESVYTSWKRNKYRPTVRRGLHSTPSNLNSAMQGLQMIQDFYKFADRIQLTRPTP
ncbi:MAG: Gfo/Idh/MocA family oxidoreductase [Leptospiraceae bacterium]|nr:Gfo/Idh/MocA family oxidoreductase [Leptospiraceae bacterium]